MKKDKFVRQAKLPKGAYQSNYAGLNYYKKKAEEAAKKDGLNK